jgi:hypothetical protein
MKTRITIFTSKRSKDFWTLYGYSRPNKHEVFMGNFGFTKPSYREYVLLELSDYDREYFAEGIDRLKPEERLYRYSSSGLVYGLLPLIKVNIVKGLVYFLVPNATDATFETRGEKVNWLNVYDEPELVEALLDSTPHRWIENWDVVHYHDPIVYKEIDKQ